VSQGSNGDRYQVLGELGRGGMGAVYRALDHATGREVALKVMTSPLSGHAKARFQREGELTARLDHPGIVRVHDCGEVRGRPFLAYELVTGRELAEVLPEVDLRRKVELIRDAARALGYAHAQGILHRDVKAENVLVGVDGRARVADFGLATAQDLDRLTQTGALLGTPSHMSPEQIQGKADLSPATDVWSLGVLLYKALTGRVPFSGENTLELIGQILGADLTKPRKLAPEVPRAVELVCLRALRRAPEQRYPDGEAFAQALDDWLEGRPLTGGSPPPAAIAGGLLLALAALGVGAWATLGREPEVESPAPLGQEGLTTNPRETGDDAEPPPPTPAEARQARDALRDALRLAPAERGEALAAWLEDHPRQEARDRARAEQALRALRRERPLRVLVHLDASSVGSAKEELALVHPVFLDAHRLLTQGADTRLLGWDLRRPQAPVWEASGWSGSPRYQTAAASPDGASLVAGGHEQSFFFQPASGDRRVIPGLKSARRFAFDPGGGRLFAIEGGDREGALHALSWPDLKPIGRYPRPRAHSLAISPDGALVAAGAGGWSLRSDEARATQGVWIRSVEPAQELARFRTQALPTVLTFDAAGEALLVGDSLGQIHAHKVSFADEGSPFLGSTPPDPLTGVSRAHMGVVRGIALSHSGEVVFSVGGGGQGGRSELVVWSYPKREELSRLSRPHNPQGAEVSPDGRLLAVGSDAGVVELWSVDAWASSD
jgi:serine/threonine protein kinase/WD40 repeat protein